MMLTADRLREILKYDPETGEWMWLTKSSVYSPRKIGTKAGSYNKKNNAIYINVDMKRYSAHRLAWLYVTGAWPKNEIDHIYRDRSDNRFANLREATRSENARNIGLRPDNATGLKRVGFDKRRNRYRTRIVVHGKEIWLGYFDTPEKAHAAYCEAAKKYHGQYANIGCS